jgi:hypothetical protein
MIRYLGSLLSRSAGHPVAVRYLSKAEPDAVWRDGHLLSLDPQGACFAMEDQGVVVECLPWGVIGAIRVRPAPTHEP